MQRKNLYTTRKKERKKSRKMVGGMIRTAEQKSARLLDHNYAAFISCHKWPRVRKTESRNLREELQKVEMRQEEAR